MSLRAVLNRHVSVPWLWEGTSTVNSVYLNPRVYKKAKSWFASHFCWHEWLLATGDGSKILINTFCRCAPEADAGDCHCLLGLRPQRHEEWFPACAPPLWNSWQWCSVSTPDRLRLPQLRPPQQQTSFSGGVCMCLRVKREWERKRSLLVCLWERVCFMFNACIHVCVLPYISPFFACVCRNIRPRPVLHSPRTLHRCWDACLCIAIVRKCHCWHLTRASAPTQACLLATCGPTSSAADTGSLVFSPTIPLQFPSKVSLSGLLWACERSIRWAQ